MMCNEHKTRLRLQYQFPLDRFLCTFILPANLSAKECERICAFLRSIVIEESA